MSIQILIIAILLFVISVILSVATLFRENKMIKILKLELEEAYEEIRRLKHGDNA